MIRYGLVSMNEAAKAPAFNLELVPLDRGTLQSHAYKQLREALMSGRFPPGQAITVRAAAHALGTSPMPVRGALHRLEAEGALSMRDQRRTLMIPELTQPQLSELCDLRVLLEGLAAERAATSITDEEIGRVAEQCATLRAAAEAGDVQAYTNANWDFHTTIYHASRMPRLLEIVESFWLRIGPYVNLMLPDRESLVASVPNHEDALDALRRRDGAAARAAINSDITECAAGLAQRIGGTSPAPAPVSRMVK
jgi:DNA-binding GntR family transcriptional regulator